MSEKPITTAPTESGYYWVRLQPDGPREPVYWKGGDVDGHGLATVLGSEDAADTRCDYIEWGPRIPTPDEAPGPGPVTRPTGLDLLHQLFDEHTRHAHEALDPDRAFRAYDARLTVAERIARVEALQRDSLMQVGTDGVLRPVEQECTPATPEKPADRAEPPSRQLGRLLDAWAVRIDGEGGWKAYTSPDGATTCGFGDTPDEAMQDLVQQVTP